MGGTVQQCTRRIETSGAGRKRREFGVLIPRLPRNRGSGGGGVAGRKAGRVAAAANAVEQVVASAARAAPARVVGNTEPMIPSTMEVANTTNLLIGKGLVGGNTSTRGIEVIATAISSQPMHSW
jgi:hypothetical protein